LVRRPDLAFAPTTLGKGYLDYFVTLEEFARILDQLYLNNWVLVNMHAPCLGSPIFCEIDQHAIMEHREGWTRFPRRHIDGIAFSDQADNLAPFFGVANVIDTESRTSS
jgi:hypothetical protein